jgi:hypothetical protein
MDGRARTDGTNRIKLKEARGCKKTLRTITSPCHHDRTIHRGFFFLFKKMTCKCKYFFNTGAGEKKSTARAGKEQGILGEGAGYLQGKNNLPCLHVHTFLKNILRSICTRAQGKIKDQWRANTHIYTHTPM